MRPVTKNIIMILAVVAVLIISAFLLRSGKKNEAVKLSLENVKVSLEKYLLTEGQYPGSLHSLSEKGIATEAELKDPWGSEYIYVPCYKDLGKGKKKVSTYMLSSSGPDRKSWTKDDIQ